jgi:hypothetical protein
MLPMNAFALSELLIAMGCTGLGALVFKTCEDRRLGRIWLLLNLAIAIYGAGCFFGYGAWHGDSALFGFRLFIFILFGVYVDGRISTQCASNTLSLDFSF